MSFQINGGNRDIIPSNETHPSLLGDRLSHLYVTPEGHGYDSNNTVSENTTAIINAVAEAYSSGKSVGWSPNNHVINDTIPNFHNVNHFGYGTVQRGADVWHVTPQGDDENTIYVTTIGSDNNDGISSDHPLLTGQKAVTVLESYRSHGVLPGVWNINLSAGVYDRIRFPDEGFITENNVTIKGEERDVSSGNVWFMFFEGTPTGVMTVGGVITGTTSGATATITHVFLGKHRVVRADIISGTPAINETFTDSLSGNSGQVEYLSPTPTTIIREGATQAAFGILGTKMELNIKNVLVEDFNGSKSAAGVSILDGGKIYGDNLHLYDNYWGCSGQNNSTINLKGGVVYDNGFENSTTQGGCGIRGLFFPKFEVGTQNAGNRSAGPLVFANSIGIRAQEGAKGHVDWSLVYGNISGGVRCLVSSRINGSGTELDDNGGSGVYVTRGSHFDDDGNCKYTNNGRNTSVGQSSTAANYISGYTVANGAVSGVIDTEHPSSGNIYSSTSAVDVHALTIAKEALNDAQFSGIAAKRISYRVMGTLAGTTGTYKRFVLRVGGQPTILSFGSSVVGSFDVELFVEFVGENRQFVSLSGKCATTPNCNSTYITADTSADMAVEFEVLVQNSSDSITIDRYEVGQVGF